MCPHSHEGLPWVLSKLGCVTQNAKCIFNFIFIVSCVSVVPRPEEEEKGLHLATGQCTQDYSLSRLWSCVNYSASR